MATITDIQVLKFMSVLMVFLFTAFSSELATLYAIIIFLDFFFQATDTFVSTKFERNDKDRLTDLFFALVAFGVFLFIVTLLNAATSLQSAIQLLSQTVPLLKGNQIAQFIVFGVVVATIETMFIFGRMMEAISEGFVSKIVNETPNIYDLGKISTWLTFATASAVFALIHIQVRGGADIPLLITFIFGMISCILVSIRKDLRAAVMLHVLNNTIAFLTAAKVIFG